MEARIRGKNPASIREANRAFIKKLVFRRGPISRRQLIEETRRKLRDI